MQKIALVWYRRDLRTADHAALEAALERGYTPVPVYVEAAGLESGGAARRWLHDALADLDDGLRSLGSRLILCRGDADTELRRVARETGATALFWHRLYKPALMRRDAELKAAWRAEGFTVESFAGDCLHEPQAVGKKAGGGV